MLGPGLANRFLSEIGIWGREEAKERLQEMNDAVGHSTHFDTVPTGPVWVYGIALLLLGPVVASAVLFNRISASSQAAGDDDVPALTGGTQAIIQSADALSSGVHIVAP
jgi:hypothetical protein